MQWNKAKNLILVLLIIVNVFFIALLGYRYFDESRQAENTQQNFVSALEKLNVFLDENIVITEKRSVYELYLSRHAQTEKDFASAFIGDTEAQNQGGNIYYYFSKDNFATFRTGGNFTITVNDGRDITKLIAENIIGEYDVLSNHNGVLHIYQLKDGIKIFNSSMRVATGNNVEISGKWAMGEEYRTSEEKSKDYMTCLLSLAKSVYKEDTEIVVLKVTQGYIMKAAASGSVRLVPVWEITTQNGIYYVNSISCEIEYSE